MNEITQLISFMQILIPIGVTARIAYCFGIMHIDDDQEKSYKVRIRNALIFTVLAESVGELIQIVFNYF